MKDIEITKLYNKEKIVTIGKKIGLNYEDLILYGDYKAKIKKDNIKNDRYGKLILVTAINPTPYGEGKTTVAIGLTDSLNRYGKKAICVLREPSLGPVFGLKGGACGGGRSQVVPMEDINLHFTGDLHAITSANNLISAAIDNHIYQGNDLKIKEIYFKRCLDVNDRSLRNISYSIKGNVFTSGFNITAASEVMSIFCLSKNLSDLRYRLSNITIGINEEGKILKVKDLNIEGSLVALLKDAFNPNLVQTLENSPVIIHGGPFANISFGCNSITSTDLALKLSDYVVLEAGFGADLGGEKFLDIKCREGKFNLNCIVLTATIRALKYNGDSLESGLANLGVHVDNLLKFSSDIIVVLNKFDIDTEKEIDLVRRYSLEKGVDFEISESYLNGSENSKNLVEKILDICDRPSKINYIYELNDTVKDKIYKVVSSIYRCKDIIYSDKALKKLDFIDSNKLSDFPVCIAKTQYSISDDPKKLGAPENYSVMVHDIEVNSGSELIIVYLGTIYTMPGLPINPNYKIIDIDKNDNIIGLF